MKGITKLNLWENITLVSLQGLPDRLPVMADIFAAFSGAGIIIDMISQTAPVGGKVDLSFTCYDDDMVKVLALSKELGERYQGIRPLVSSGNSKIQLYGPEMPQLYGVFSDVLDCLREIPLHVHLITTSEVDISLLVDTPHGAEAMEALHDRFLT